MEVDAVHAIAIPKAFRAVLASNWPWSLGSNKTIGKRGFGTVYKGKLLNSCCVVIKMSNSFKETIKSLLMRLLASL